MFLLPPATVTHGGLYLPKRQYTIYLDDKAYLSPSRLIGVIPLAQHSVLECDIKAYKNAVYTSSHVTVTLDGSLLVLHAGSSSMPSDKESGQESNHAQVLNDIRNSPSTALSFLLHSSFKHTLFCQNPRFFVFTRVFMEAGRGGGSK